MKKIHRFLIKEIPTEQSFVLADKELVHLIKNVLKLSIGESCIVFCDESDDYLCLIKKIDKAGIILEKQSTSPRKIIPKKVIACISVLKKDNFELVVQKLTEIGVQEIVPILSGRTVKQSVGIDRLQKISDEALEQSGGSKRVKIYSPETLEKSLESHKSLVQCYFDIEGAKNIENSNDSIVFYIGPEGGWSDEDKVLFNKYKVSAYTLGTTVLRAETASIICGYKLLWY